MRANVETKGLKVNFLGNNFMGILIFALLLGAFLTFGFLYITGVASWLTIVFGGITAMLLLMVVYLIFKAIVIEIRLFK